MFDLQVLFASGVGSKSSLLIFDSCQIGHPHRGPYYLLYEIFEGLATAECILEACGFVCGLHGHTGGDLCGTTHWWSPAWWRGNFLRYYSQQPYQLKIRVQLIEKKKYLSPVRNSTENIVTPRVASKLCDPVRTRIF